MKGGAMTYNRLIAAAATVLIVLTSAAYSEARDVKVMAVIGLLDYGEDAKVMTVYDFNKYKPSYNDFQKLMGRSITLRDMVKKGWRIIQVEPITDDYFIVIFESDT
jgi:hypothetical protein